ncbi:hypothetical protein COT97_04095 [Candidatus Falkowbacteria bacterium CG10_big_fil_rev_8_21_14_0_10_39_11]|uniref:HD/PDEase domain-containing protein n=1 Tax=Candidatus Falkowbacteria bacterium CG10_big_fil_rev_8_21_14_0_10_39_11 TaxID=1974565 RepID=A0A2H0V4A7_9BACT|nr:MAG: hypothetical protein COT97_04095 [Candidatus Falkowbacteria bacterium CG10_big_fil_rev_8_21_14_0_10_39_11]
MQSKTDNIKQVEDYVKSIMLVEVAHDFKHVDRVRKWALRLAKNEGFQDLESVEIASLMHDIGLSQAQSRSMHGEVGANMAVNFLSEKTTLSPQRIDEVANAIRFHNSHRGGNGILLAILRDADMLDLFGAVGLMRALTSKYSKLDYDPENIKGETWQMTSCDFDQRFASGVGIGNYIVDQINFQLSCDYNLNTETAKQLARPMIEFMRHFVQQLEVEVASD